ncbi:hypothetical protein SAMD00023353_0602920 [Rosellinia necatrix]|uniref:Uncharacterized protein n=1 Tax=Rosellinia necatrix TaxID=77044 RepID=A0A1S7UKX6_ROSNE|nr:hypothetical protein SAMD00023353_0602920 [Rosellinia necatrix]
MNMMNLQFNEEASNPTGNPDEARRRGTMSNRTPAPAHHGPRTIYSLLSRSEAPLPSLSSGAIAGISVAGLMLFVLTVAPILIYVAKQHNRRRAAACPVSSLSFAEHGAFTHVEEVSAPPKRLRKRSTASERETYYCTDDTGTAEGGGGSGGGGRSARHLLFPTVTPDSARPRGCSFRGGYPGGGVSTDGSTSGNASSDGGANGTTPCADTCGHGDQTQRSPEKHRGRAICQNRQKTSWIDEDALHGPRISPKKRGKRKGNWLRGNGLTRTLSRHLSFGGHRAPELARSPTLPCTESGQMQSLAESGPAKLPESQNVGGAQNTRSELQGDSKIEPRFPVRQPLEHGGSLNPPGMVHTQAANPRLQQVPVSGGTHPCPQCRNHMAMSAAEQLAGRARVPGVGIAAVGQIRPPLQQSHTDAELLAILRRTAESLQDGNRSTRRQTMMHPALASPSTTQNRVEQGSAQGPENGQNYTRSVEVAPSPTKSEKSAPAATLYSELEGSSPGTQPEASQSNPPWQTHRRTHTRRISLISQVSMLSEADSLAAGPSRRGSQADILQTALSSPSRSIQMTPPRAAQPTFISRSNSMRSELSSALSTVYSEEESGLPSVLKLDDTPVKESEAGKGDTVRASRASMAFGSKKAQNIESPGDNKAKQEAQPDFDVRRSPRPLHIRKATLGQHLPNGSHRADVTTSMPQEANKQPTAKPSYALSTEAAADDPFTTYGTPTQATPKRLSKVFSPLPAELPGNSKKRSADEDQRSGTPTPPSSRRRVVPPPHCLRPNTGSPTSEGHDDPQVQIQPPSREPSIVVSEGGLSSVYESYRYSRYSDSFEDAQTPGTTLTVPSIEAPSAKTRWDEENTRATSAKKITDGHGDEGREKAFRSAHARLNSVVSGGYTYPIGPPPLALSRENGSVAIGYTMVDAVPRSQQTRDISGVSAISATSVYSQDDDGQDRLAPLVPFPAATTASGRHARRVTSTVAELRRMNSQVSCVSGYSTATTNIAGEAEITSPTIPTLRGGGFSPGKKGMGGGAKNYLALGSNLSAKEVKEEQGNTQDGKTASAAGRENGIAQSASKGGMDGVTVRRGGMKKSRRNTVVEGFEQDLDRARQILRESRDFNLQTVPEVSSKGPVSNGRMAQVAE